MKRAFNNLFRRGEANPIKILCLGVGLAIGLTMLAEVIFEQSYDNFLPRLEDTYRITERFKQNNDPDWRAYPQTAGAIAPGVKRYCPEVEAATRFTWLQNDMHLVAEDQREVTANALLCDSSFFEVFPRRILLGENPHTGLEKAGNAYISSRLAKTLGTDIVGHTLTWKEFPDFKLNIAGIFEEFPENTHLPRIDVAVALPTIKWIRWDGRNNWIGNDCYISYIRLYPGAKSDQLTDNVKQMLEANLPMEDLKKARRRNLLLVGLQPHYEHRLPRLRHTDVSGSGIELYSAGHFGHGEPRQKHRHLPLLRGEEHGHLPDDSQRIGIARVAEPRLSSADYLQDVVQEQIGHSLRSLFPPSTVLVCVAVTALIIVLCGVMPGYLYTRIPVTYAYRRYTENKRHWKLGLLFVQFLLTTFFVSILAVISLQYRALTNYDPGFEYKARSSRRDVGLSRTVRTLQRQQCI